MVEKECKGCSSSVKISDEEIEKMFGDLKKVKKVNVISQKVYEQRIASCQECKYLDFGTTCRQCGCIVEIKAKLAKGECPYPGSSRW